MTQAAANASRPPDNTFMTRPAALFGHDVALGRRL
jgi:hypothetical protein